VIGEDAQLSQPLLFLLAFSGNALQAALLEIVRGNQIIQVFLLSFLFGKNRVEPILGICFPGGWCAINRADHYRRRQRAQECDVELHVLNVNNPALRVERHGLLAGEGDAALVIVQCSLNVERARTAASMKDEGRASVRVAREGALEPDSSRYDGFLLEGFTRLFVAQNALGAVLVEAEDRLVEVPQTCWPVLSESGVTPGREGE
jgi:hypothetical protein